MRVARLVLGAWLSWTASVAPQSAHADQAAVIEGRQFTLEVGERVWIRSTARSEFNFGGLEHMPNILSELKWNNMRSNILEFHAEALWRERFIFNVAAGFGYAGGGTLRDQDFDGPNRTGLVSDTISTADDDGVSYINVDIGYRMVQWNVRDGRARSFLDLLAGYQRWKERYVAANTVCLFTSSQAGCPGPDPRRAVTEEFSYSNVRLGLRTEIELINDLAIKAKGMAIPWTSFTLTDIHHLRTPDLDPDTPLRQDPSFRASSSNPFWNGGWGVEAEAGLVYRIWQTLKLEAGYQFWTIRAGTGGILARGFSDEVLQPFNFAKTTRQGFIFGLNYTF